MKAVIYARFSSNRQNETSIEAQERFCRDYAAIHDIDIIGVYADKAISGKGSKTGKRIEYQRMMRAAEKKQFDIILIHKYDRIGRNLFDHAVRERELERIGIQLIAVSQDYGTSKESKLIKSLVWSLSEHYIENLAEETRKGLRENALKAVHNGGVAPFGYDVIDGKYVINDLEAGYVRRMYSACINGSGYTDLITEMESAGITGKRGKPIRNPQINDILHNEKYTGAYIYSERMEKTRSERRTKPNAIRIENAFPAIISRSEWERVQSIMESHKHTGKAARHEYLCSGLVYCSCGAKMHGMTTHRKGHEYQYYVCSAKCGAGTISAETVDTAAINYVREFLSDDNQNAIAGALRSYQQQEGNRQDEFRKALTKKIKEKERQADNILKNMSVTVLPAEVLAAMGAELQSIKAEISVLSKTEPPKDFTTDYIKTWLQSIKTSPDSKAIHLLIERIDLIPSAGDDPDSKFSSIKFTSAAASVVNSVCDKSYAGHLDHIFPKLFFGYEKHL